MHIFQGNKDACRAAGPADLPVKQGWGGFRRGDPEKGAG